MCVLVLVSRAQPPAFHGAGADCSLKIARCALPENSAGPIQSGMMTDWSDAMRCAQDRAPLSFLPLSRSDDINWVSMCIETTQRAVRWRQLIGESGDWRGLCIWRNARQQRRGKGGRNPVGNIGAPRSAVLTIRAPKKRGSTQVRERTLILISPKILINKTI